VLSTPKPFFTRHALQITGISLAFSMLPLICSVIILAASLNDIATRTIPNGLAAALAITGIAMGAIDGYLIGSVLAAGGVFVVAAFCWRRGWMGGGDVKLLGAAALGMPSSSVLTFVLAVAVAGGVLSLFYMIARHLISCSASPRPNGLFARAVRVERWRIRRAGPLPYACAIAVGVLFVNVVQGTP
jgi:prepilin peptidase CpaA